MVEYNKEHVKLSDSQLNKLKSAVKNRQNLTLRTNIKMLKENNLSHELLSTARQTTKLRNAFEKNVSADIKFFKSQIVKIIESRGFLGSLLSQLAGPLRKVLAPLLKKYFGSIGNSSCCFNN